MIQLMQWAAQWQVPTLLLYAGHDRLVDAKASAYFATAELDRRSKP